MTLGHIASKQAEDPVTQGAVGLRNSLRSLELQQQTVQRKTRLEPRGTVATLGWLELASERLVRLALGLGTGIVFIFQDLPSKPFD